MKIIGIIPAGGKGLRLGLPFPKELMPIRFDAYYPVSLHTLRGMLRAGASEIHWVISDEKTQLRAFYENGDFRAKMFWHLQNEGSGRTILCPARVSPDADIVLFGLPDTVYTDLDAFGKIVARLQEGQSQVVLGLFRGARKLRVDRFRDGKLFVKSTYDESRSAWFWGVLGWTRQYWRRAIQKLEEDPTLRVEGQFLNALATEFPLDAIKLGEYVDLGTWDEVARFIRIRSKRFEQVTRLDEADASNAEGSR